MKKSTGMALIFGVGWAFVLVAISHRINKHVEPILTNFEIGAVGGMIIATILAVALLNREQKAARQRKNAYTEACVAAVSTKKNIQDMRDARYRLDEKQFDLTLEEAANLIAESEKESDPKQSAEKISKALDSIRAIDKKIAEMVNIRVINDHLFPEIDDRIAKMQDLLQEGLKDLSRLHTEDPYSGEDVGEKFAEVPQIMKNIGDLRQSAWEKNTMVLQQFASAAEDLKRARELLAKFERIVTSPARILARIEDAKKHFPIMLGIIEVIKDQLRVRDGIYEGVMGSVERAKEMIGTASGSNWLTGYAILSTALHQLMELAKEEGLEIDEAEILDLDDER